MISPEWMGIVAHDLRQPASVISFSAQLLMRFSEGLGEREAKSVARICSSSATPISSRASARVTY